MIETSRTPESTEENGSITFIGPSFGVSGNPLYWNETWIALTNLRYSVEVISVRKLSRPQTKARIVASGQTLPCTLASVIRHVLGGHTTRIVVNEFSALSAFSLIFTSIFAPRIIRLLLVENSPVYLVGYGTVRTGKYHTLARRIIASLAHRVITNNTEGRQYLESIGVLENKIITGVYLTSNLRATPKSVLQLRPLAAGDSFKRTTYSIVAQLIPRKGITRVMHEITLIPRDLRNRLHVHVYGDGESRTQLELFIWKEELQNCVTVHGNLSREELSQELSQCDVILVPTLADYRSLAAFEGLSLGKPLIISKYDGSNKEVVEHHLNGFVYDPLNFGELSNRLIEIAEGKWDLDAMGRYSAERSLLFSAGRGGTTIDRAVRLLGQISRT